MTDWPDAPFTRADLATLGCTEADLRRSARLGEIHPLLRGVFVPSHLEATLDLRTAAVAKVVRPHHVVTDRTAAWVHGIDVHAYADHDGAPPIETCALRGREPTSLDGVDGRNRDLKAVDVMQVGGITVTTPLRTALDLGCCLRRREAFAALCTIARAHHLTRRDYMLTLNRYRRRRGVVQLRQLVALVDSRFESQREAWCFLAIADAGLDLPEPQVWVEIDGVPTYRLDLAYRRRRVCVEYDGDEGHSTSGQRAHDKERRRWLRNHGWTVIVLRQGDFTRDALERWLRELRAALDPTYTNRRW
jgi:hypothetical protein